ncbi:MAG: nucleoside triphosphate pyrophosphohydrolase [candidate division Zixibacteria bacterium]|nr:nucleoside triphosphate pyrophosphohydrolase [candidate division Zixibacteria bacterium]
MKDTKAKILDPKTPPFERLKLTMAYLRSEKGCSWDRQQTHLSLLPYLIEETYELAEAIESEDTERIKEELGDFLCQAIFHAQIASDNGHFEIDDSITVIVEKLIRRHPHIFKEEKDLEPHEVRNQWEQIKKGDKEKTKKSSLSGLPKEMPALLRAFRIGEKAAGMGFDWEKAENVLEKIDEEISEVRAELGENPPEKLAEEIGDLLFAVASLARKADINPELALRQSLNKFQLRFEKMEKEVDKQKKKLYNLSPDELNSLWEASKKRK